MRILRIVKRVSPRACSRGQKNFPHFPHRATLLIFWKKRKLQIAPRTPELSLCKIRIKHFKDKYTERYTQNTYISNICSTQDLDLSTWIISMLYLLSMT